MITRPKLAEKLRDYQIRSQHKCPALTIFSPKPHITSWLDVSVASLWAFLFCVLLVSSYVALYFRHFLLSFLSCLSVSFFPYNSEILGRHWQGKGYKITFVKVNLHQQ